MNAMYQAAKVQAEKLGFIITCEQMESGIFGYPPVLVVKVDRIGPPAMMQHWKRSPFNDRFCSGAWYFFIEWVAKLTIAGELQDIKSH
jgi:hypothetical protein